MDKARGGNHPDLQRVECRQVNAATTRSAWTVRTLKAAGETVSAIVADTGHDPVVFLHGNSSTKSVWVRQLAATRDCGRSVLAPDLPGHGESEDAHLPDITYSLPGYAAVVGALLDVLNWMSVDVVGWSLGGHIGLELLATDNRVRSLLIVGTPPVPLQPDSLADAFHRSEIMDLTGKRDFTEAEALAYGSAMMGGSQLLSRELLESLKRTDGNARQLLFASALSGMGANQRTTAEKIEKPLCVVHGEHDPFVRLDYLRALRYRALWRNRIYLIAGAGHAPHWQCPLSFNNILLDFLGAAETR
ncbi:MAG: alpha/beta hydrolase [Xanthobacteraceae bacterium]